MAKKYEKKQLKKESEDTENEFGVKKWVIKTMIMAGFLFALVVMMEWFFSIPMLTDTLIAVSIVVSLGFIHEGLHYREAVRLGYNPKWYRTKVMMGFEINHENTKEWDRHKKIIANAPYKVIIPVSFVILIIGIAVNSLGLIVAAVGSFLLHAVSYTQEGKDV